MRRIHVTEDLTLSIQRFIEFYELILFPKIKLVHKLHNDNLDCRLQFCELMSHRTMKVSVSTFVLGMNAIYAAGLSVDIVFGTCRFPLREYLIKYTLNTQK